MNAMRQRLAWNQVSSVILKSPLAAVSIDKVLDRKIPGFAQKSDPEHGAQNHKYIAVVMNSYRFLYGYYINLESTYIVTAVETQGRYGNGTGREFVSEYMIDYLRPGSKWIRYRNRSGHTLMTANQETTTAVRRVLVPPIVASRIRIVPHSKQMRTICLRMELYGCLHRNGLLFYSTLPAGSRVGGVDFRDKTFENSDLYTETGIKRGLGLLSDGYVSENSPFDGNNPNGSWIGWSKHHTGQN
ncbi:unnamed protein product [Angiostrongylus costaricensis]|uniref:F5/8 type C domain-containing protein n=1 Tax=Angiostrongylus costaricensis TaxID=334426 RepID=A0A0R3P9M1_ANGCS|nr:unnamed protein product [Angiostrongylus costaricensis]